MANLSLIHSQSHYRCLCMLAIFVIIPVAFLCSLYQTCLVYNRRLLDPYHVPTWSIIITITQVCVSMLKH